VIRATEGERGRLGETFAALCRIDSPSGRERACADWVAAELEGMGLDVHEDDTGSETGSDAGNLLARLSGRSGESVLICAHLDTVPATAPIEPVLVDGGWENANQAILGADNKAAVAVALELARRLTNQTEAPEVGLELLFTTCEEVALRGAKAFDAGQLHSPFGYVFDHASPIGEIVLASPTYYRIEADIQGRAAHAGIRPEKGRSAILAAARAIAAMPLGRLDAETTANVGKIAGGTNANVVPEQCRVEAEARSLAPGRAEELATELIDHFQEAADASECDLDVGVQRLFEGYRTKQRDPTVVLADRALRACGYEPRPITTGGGSDANALISSGFRCTNLANGTERNHEPTERVSVDALEGMLDVAIALVREAPAVFGGSEAVGPEAVGSEAAGPEAVGP
jgi:tripeptide aminopeptidase